MYKKCAKREKVPEGSTIPHVTAVEAFHIQSDSDPYCQFVATITKTRWKHENFIAATNKTDKRIKIIGNIAQNVYVYGDTAYLSSLV